MAKGAPGNLAHWTARTPRGVQTPCRTWHRDLGGLLAGVHEHHCQNVRPLVRRSLVKFGNCGFGNIYQIIRVRDTERSRRRRIIICAMSRLL